MPYAQEGASSAKMLEQLLGGELRLLAGGHVLERDEALLQLVLADEGDEGDVARVGVGHLLLHFGGIGIDLGGNAGGTGGASQFKAASGFGGAEIDEEQFDARIGVGRIELELVEHVVDAVGTEGDAHTGKTGETEDAGKVVVTTTAGDAADLDIEGFDFEDAAGVVVEAAGEGEIEFERVAEAVAKGFEHEGHFVATAQTDFAFGQYAAHGVELLGVGAGEGDDGLEACDLFVGKTGGGEFFVDLVETDLVEFVDGHGDVDNLIGRTDHFGNAGEDFAVVDLDGDTDAEAGEDFVDNLHEFDLIEERIGADNVGIALVELAITAFLRTVSTPYGLDLVALEGEGEFLAVLHHETGEGDGEVVTQSFLAELGGEGGCGGGFVVGGGDGAGEVAAVENFEEEFVAFLTIFAHQGGEVLHGGGFDLAEAVEAIDAADGVEDIVAARHFDKAEIAGAFGNCRFLCHEWKDKV